ncbi:MAG: YHS domain-containing protein [Acidobacteria bacterium]|nr:YHS domain-containing protein [Acidobacteriota bacterium]
MLSIAIRILSAILLIWLFRRLLGMFLGSARANRPKDQTGASSNHMVKDPVCGMYMDARLAVRLKTNGEDFYFCSEDCKNKYLSQSAGSAGNSASG